uniref:Uncharacterized protein n=1 Tax=viral metagenome TaxID=1070528 RepID=A0A6C0CXW0_9ZZZZ
MPRAAEPEDPPLKLDVSLGSESNVQEEESDNIIERSWKYISDPDNRKSLYKKIPYIINGIMVVYVLGSCVYMINTNREYDSDKEFLTRKDLTESEQNMSNASLVEDMDKRINNIKINAGQRFKTLFKQLFICSLVYLLICKIIFGPILTGEKDQLFAILIMFILGGTGKMIEGYGLRGCLNIPGIKTNNPSQVLIFDMFFTNTFAYLMDFVFAFAITIIGLKSSDEDRLKIMNNNLELSLENVCRYLAYLFTVLSFVLLSGIIRPKVGLALYRIIGVPIVDAKDLRKDKNGSLILPTDVSKYIQDIRKEDESKDKPKYDENTSDETILEDNPVLSMMGDTSVKYSDALKGIFGKKVDDPLLYYNTAYKGMGIIMAGVVELIVFICILFPARKFLLYNFKTNSQNTNNEDYIEGKSMLIFKNVIVFVILATLFFLGRYLTYGEWLYVEREDNDQKIIIPKSNSDSSSCDGPWPLTINFNYVLLIISSVLLCLTSIYILWGSTNMMLYVGILVPFIFSYGFVAFITNFLIPKENELDNKEPHSKDWRSSYMNIFNPERDESGRGFSFGISFVIALAMTLMMWFVSGRRRPDGWGLTKDKPDITANWSVKGPEAFRTTGILKQSETSTGGSGVKSRKGKKSSAKKSKGKAKGKKK